MEVVPMSYRFLPLSKTESLNAKHWGLKFALENEDRWINVNASNYELQTYDRGTTYVVLEGVAYAIARDFVFIDKNVRLLVGRDLNLNTDIIDDTTDPAGELFTEVPTESPAPEVVTELEEPSVKKSNK